MKTVYVSEQEVALHVSAVADIHSHLIKEPVKVLSLIVVQCYTKHNWRYIASNGIVH